MPFLTAFLVGRIGAPTKNCLLKKKGTLIQALYWRTKRTKLITCSGVCDFGTRATHSFWRQPSALDQVGASPANSLMTAKDELLNRALEKTSILPPIETWFAFSTPKCRNGTHNLQVAMFRCIM